VSQVRTAADAFISTLWFDADHRELRLQRVSTILERTQHRNRHARCSHTKTRRKELHALGLYTSRMSCCIPP
jgi:hypothetical protein